MPAIQIDSMSIRYDASVAVAPFILAPAPGTLQQRVMVAPQRTIPYADDFANAISQFTVAPRLESAVIAQVFAFRQFLVISISIQTDIREDFSARRGLSVTFGALVASSLRNTPNLCQRIQEAFERYFALRFGSPLTVGNVGTMLHKGSVDADSWNVDLLIRIFQETFGLGQRQRLRRPYWLEKLIATWRLRGTAIVQPVAAVEDLPPFWKLVDAELGTLVADENTSAPPADDHGGPTLSLSIGLLVFLACFVVTTAAFHVPTLHVYWRLAGTSVAALSSLAQLIGTLKDSLAARSLWARIALAVSLPTGALATAVDFYVLWFLLAPFFRSV